MKSVLNERVTEVEIDNTEEDTEYEEFEAEFVDHLNGSNSEIPTPDESSEDEEVDDIEEVIIPVEPAPLESPQIQAIPSEDTPSESVSSKLNARKRSFKEKLQQEGETVLYKQLYAMKERYELSVVDFSNILANFISALTSGNYPPKRRQKLTEVEKLRMKIEQLSQNEKQELAAQLNPVPASVGTVTMAAPDPEADNAPF